MQMSTYMSAPGCIQLHNIYWIVYNQGMICGLVQCLSDMYAVCARVRLSETGVFHELRYAYIQAPPPQALSRLASSPGGG